MNDLTELTRLRADVSEPSDELLSDIRARIGAPRVVKFVARRSSWRRSAYAGGIAAAVAAAVIIATGGGGQSGPGGTDHIGSQSPTEIRMATAGQVLAGAARYTSPALAAGEYQYLREHLLWTTVLNEPPTNGAYEFTENTSEYWLPADNHDTRYVKTVNNISVDYPTAAQRAFAADAPGGIPSRDVTWSTAKGTQDWRQVYPHLDDEPQLVTGSGSPGDDVWQTVWDDPTPVRLAALPRDPDVLRANAYRVARAQHAEVVKYGKVLSVDAAVYRNVTNLLASQLVPDDLRAALYKVVASIPGIKLIGSLANYDGVDGVAVGRVDDIGVEHDLIFDRVSGKYIGDRTVVTRPNAQYHLGAGTVIGYSAISTGVRGAPTLPA